MTLYRLHTLKRCRKTGVQVLALNHLLYTEISIELHRMRTFYLTITDVGPEVIVDDLGLKQ